MNRRPRLSVVGLLSLALLASSAVALPASAAGAGSFVAIGHKRVLSGLVKAGDAVSFPLSGVPLAGVSAVALSVTVTTPAVAGTLTLFPYGTRRPGIVSLSFARGRTTTATVLVAPDSRHRGELVNGSPAAEAVSATVLGYYAAPGTARAAHATTAFVAVTPKRLTALAVKAKGGVSVTVLGKAGVAASHVAGVVLTVTVVAPTHAGGVAVYPAGGRKPKASVVFGAGDSVTSMVTVRAGLAGRIFLSSSASAPVRVDVDVVGYLLALRVPEAPTKVAAVAGNATIDVTWARPTSDGGAPITSYQVVLTPGGTPRSVSAVARSLVVSGLANGTAYAVTVRAVNSRGAGSAASAGIVTPYTLPGVPTGVTVGPGGPGQLAVHWVAPADNGGSAVTSYQVTAAPGGQAVSSLSTSALISGVAVGSWSTVTVAAVNAAGSSAPSAAGGPGTAGGTTRISVSTTGGETDENSFSAAVSADGRYVAFESEADNVVAHDSNGEDDVFVRDRLTEVTQLVSANSAGNDSGNNDSDYPSISADGRYVVFQSAATDLVAGGAPAHQVYLRDTVLGTTTLVSQKNGVVGDQPSSGGQISADGSTVVFESSSSNLGGPHVAGTTEVYSVSRVTGVVTPVTVGVGGTAINAGADDPGVSADGTVISYEADATNLVVAPAVPPGKGEIYAYNVLTATTRMVSVSPAGLAGDDTSNSPSIAADGRYVVYQSPADNLVAGDTDGEYDIFVTDLTTGVSIIANRAVGGGLSKYGADRASISGDGRYVTYSAQASDLVAGAVSLTFEIYRTDWVNGVTTLVTRGPDGSEGDSSSDHSHLSEDGQHVVLESGASNLTAQPDLNEDVDIYVVDAD